MINLYDKFCKINREVIDYQNIIESDGVIKAYYGISNEGKFRISFLSNKSSGINGMTRSINIVQGHSSENNYWTCFDLINDDLLSVFCSFGEDLIECILHEKNEFRALSLLRSRFNTWLALFRKSRTPLSLEKAKGLYGELYFIKYYMIDKYGITNAILSWSGPDGYHKDFAINDTWYEIKTISSGASIVKISSIQQLESEQTGKLVLMRVEEMADTYAVKDSCIMDLINSIISQITENYIKDKFLEKLAKLGFDFCDDLSFKKYQLSKIEKYIVNNDFPIIKESDIKSQAINNISYELIIKLIQKYQEE